MFALKVVLKSLRRGRLVLAWIAIVLPAALVTGAANFLLDASAKLRTEVRTSGPNLVVRGASIPKSLARGRYAERCDTVGDVGTRTAPIIKVNPERAGAVWTWWRVQGRWPREGECLLGRKLADLLDRRDREELRVSGILETDGDEERAMIVPIGADDPWTRVDFVIDGDAAEVERVAASMRSPGVSAEPVRALTASEGAVTARLRGIFLFVGIFVLAVSGLGIAAIFTTLVQEQRREIALVSALGGKPMHAVKMLVAQAAVLLVSGLVVGGALGVAVSDVLGYKVFGLATAVRPLAFAAALGACAAMAAAAMIVPARRALAVEPAVVLREE